VSVYIHPPGRKSGWEILIHPEELVEAAQLMRRVCKPTME
jgi:hypothetical protein